MLSFRGSWCKTQLLVHVTVSNLEVPQDNINFRREKTEAANWMVSLSSGAWNLPEPASWVLHSGACSSFKNVLESFPLCRNMSSDKMTGNTLKKCLTNGTLHPEIYKDFTYISSCNRAAKHQDFPSCTWRWIHQASSPYMKPLHQISLFGHPFRCQKDKWKRQAAPWFWQLPHAARHTDALWTIWCMCVARYKFCGPAPEVTALGLLK